MSALAVTCEARTQDVALWRGETQVFRLQSFAKIGGRLPEGVTMRRGVLRDVDYRESPEALRWQQTTHELYGGNGLDIDRNLRALHKYTVADRVDFSVAEAKGCPKVVEFAVAADAKPGGPHGGRTIQMNNRDKASMNLMNGGEGRVEE